MSSIFNAQIAEASDDYRVINVILTEAKYVLPTAKYIALPNEVALKLKNELNQGMSISIKKELVDNPVSKDIPLDHFEIKKPSSLGAKKSALKAKAHQRISGYTALLSAYNVYEFAMVMGKLQASGYNVLSDDKKEETFLEIINTGNEDLISDLERFLESKDVFDRMMKKYRGLKEYFREIDNAENEDELEDVKKSNKGWLIN